MRYRQVRREREREKDFPVVETYIFRGANETAQCGSTDSLSSSGPITPVFVPITAPALWDGGTRGDLKAARRCRTLEDSVAHERPPTDEHGLLHVEERECRDARDVP